MSESWRRALPQAPESSPVAWIDDLAWASRDDPDARPFGTYEAVLADWRASAADRPQDYTDAERARLDAGDLPMTDVYVARVSEAQRAVMPRLPRDPSLPLPPVGTLAEHQRRLDAQTPEVTGLPNPGKWPMCCERLCTLLLVNPGHFTLTVLEDCVGSLNGIFWWDFADTPSPEVSATCWIPELDAVREGARSSETVNVFHCRDCGRLYGGYGHT